MILTPFLFLYDSLSMKKLFLFCNKSTDKLALQLLTSFIIFLFSYEICYTLAAEIAFFSRTCYLIALDTSQCISICFFHHFWKRFSLYYYILKHLSSVNFRLCPGFYNFLSSLQDSTSFELSVSNNYIVCISTTSAVDYLSKRPQAT